MERCFLEFEKANVKWFLSVDKKYLPENLPLNQATFRNIKIFDRSKHTVKKIKHNLKVLEHGQGGLLDIYYHKGKVYVSYSE